eukprot:IDg7064t1
MKNSTFPSRDAQHYADGTSPPLFVLVSYYVTLAFVRLTLSGGMEIVLNFLSYDCAQKTHRLYEINTLNTASKACHGQLSSAYLAETVGRYAIEGSATMLEDAYAVASTHPARGRKANIG